MHFQLQGAEDSIAKHFEILSGKEEWAEKIVKPKLLVAYHHINQVIFGCISCWKKLGLL